MPIDVHAHYVPPQLIDAVASRGKDIGVRLVRSDGSAHPHRRAVGVFTSRPAAGAFARPRTNAPAFRQNDLVARSVLANRATPADDTRHVLDNVAWHALTGTQEAFAEGSGTARRYRREVSVFHALVDDEATSWKDLQELVHPDGTAIVFRALP